MSHFKHLTGDDYWKAVYARLDEADILESKLAMAKDCLEKVASALTDGHSDMVLTMIDGVIDRLKYGVV